MEVDYFFTPFHRFFGGLLFAGLGLWLRYGATPLPDGASNDTSIGLVVFGGALIISAFLLPSWGLPKATHTAEGDAVFASGQAAFRAGQTKEDCPDFAGNRDQRGMWILGWNAEQRAAAEARAISAGADQAGR
jgi:hypothetical protein